MKTALQKSPIPHSHAFEAKRLRQSVFDPNWHFHSEYQLFLVLKGSGTRFIGDDISPYKEGDITFTGPNLPHLWRSDHEATVNNKDMWSEGIVVYFHEGILGEKLLEKEEAIKIQQLFRKSRRGLSITGGTAKNIRQFFFNLLELRGFSSLLELMKILHVISESHDLKILASSGYTNTLKEADTERMNKVYAYIMKNFRRKMSATELASLTNMTPESFSRYFKTHANKTFTEFISEIRVGHACKLLIDHKMNASQACYGSGFHTVSNFNRQFKRITKRTPLSYKREFLMR